MCKHVFVFSTSGNCKHQQMMGKVYFRVYNKPCMHGEKLSQPF